MEWIIPTIFHTITLLIGVRLGISIEKLRQELKRGNDNPKTP